MSNEIPNTQKCFSRHMGLFMCEPDAVNINMTLIKHGIMPMRSADAFETAKAEIDCPDYDNEDGIALIKICGLMQKQESKFDGFCSTVKARKSICAADCDPAVKAIMLFFDTPGGFVSGTDELAECVAGCKKPVSGYISDACMSAGYYVASRCGKLSMNNAGFVGSIGVYGVIEDTSKAYEMEGVRAILVTTGEFKGQGCDGVPVSDSAVAEYQARINQINERFMASVSTGRKMSADHVKQLATGAVWGSADALKLGMIDAAETFDSAMQNLRDSFASNIPTITGANNMPENEKMNDVDVAPVAAAAPAVDAEPVAVVNEPAKIDNSALPEFQAMADVHGYDFAKTNFGKSEAEIHAAIVAGKDAEIQALKTENAALKAAQPKIAAGIEPIPVNMKSAPDKKPMYDSNGKLNK